MKKMISHWQWATIIFGLTITILAVTHADTPAPDARIHLDAPAADLASVADGSNAFALDLYNQVAKQPGNLFFSPYSISSALAMVYGGAGGQTATQMRRVLHFNLPGPRLHAAFGTLSEQLNLGGIRQGRTLYQLTVADAVWALRGLTFRPEYVRLLRDNYDAELHTADFVNAPGKAADAINQWIDQRTNHKIQNIVTPNDFDSLTAMVLVNAIYFKGNWETQFNKNSTEPQPFHLDASNQTTAPLMFHKFNCSAMQNEDLQAISLPYQGNDLSMVVLLPRTYDGLPALEAKLTSDHLHQWLAAMFDQDVNVHLPKFKMVWRMELSDVLKSMGMTNPFDRGAANFEGIFEPTMPTLLYFLSKVIHQAYVDVNEEGTEAAATTVVVVGSMAVVVQPPPMEFRADHPFLFLIRQNSTGAILFMGRVTNPVSPA